MVQFKKEIFDFFGGWLVGGGGGMVHSPLTENYMWKVYYKDLFEIKW